MTESGEVKTFMRGETEDFLAWRSQSINGFVLNEKDGKTFVLHKASCDDLEPWVPGHHLQNPKHCSTEEGALLAFVEERSLVPSYCGNCLGGHV